MKALNLINKRFDKLVVIRRSKKRIKGRGVIWDCLCDCGNTCTSFAAQLNAGIKSSCGCKKTRDLTGQVFNFLSVYSRIAKVGHRTKYRCKCICGKKITVDEHKLPRRISCGCKRIGSRPRLPIKQIVTNYVYAGYKSNASQKNISFKLSKQKFESFIFSDCVYCGDAPKTHFTKWRANENCFFNGIDRVDNKKGYLLKNCVSCCKECNYKKGNQDVLDFLRWIEKVYINKISHKSQR